MQNDEENALKGKRLPKLRPMKTLSTEHSVNDKNVQKQWVWLKVCLHDDALKHRFTCTENISV